MYEILYAVGLACNFFTVALQGNAKLVFLELVNKTWNTSAGSVPG